MVSKWLLITYNLLLNGVYWGCNPLTNLLLTSWDILVDQQSQAIMTSFARNLVLKGAKSAVTPIRSFLVKPERCTVLGVQCVLSSSRWLFQCFFLFSPRKFGEDEPILTHIFQRG